MTFVAADRLRSVRPFEVMRVLAQADALVRSGRDVIHLEVGEPDFPTAEPILRAAQAAIAGGKVKYTPALGLPELRQQISDYYRTYHDTAISADRIVVTAGATGGLLLLCALLLNPGDGLLLPDPGYPCNRNFMHLVGASAQLLACDVGHHYQPTAEQVEARWQPETRGLLLASPNNPTGSMMRDVELAAIIEVVRRQQGFLILDEIYQGLTYPLRSDSILPAHGVTGIEGVSSTVLRTADDIFVVNSFSKYFGMTGWRLGWIVAPQQAIPALERLAQNYVIAPSTIAQYAAIAAMGESSMRIHETRRSELRERRDFLVPALQQLGFGIPWTPEGAFYVYANVRSLGISSADFCEQLLLEEGVAITPGHDFSEWQADETVRFAYVERTERLAEAMQRLQSFLARRSSR